MSYGYNTIAVKRDMDADDIRGFCGGFADYLTDEQMDEVIDRLGDWFCDTPTEEDLDEFFRFEEDTIAEWLGFKDEEHLRFANENEYSRIFYSPEDGSYYTGEELEDKFDDFKAICEENGEECDYSDWEEWANRFCTEVQNTNA